MALLLAACQGKDKPEWGKVTIQVKLDEAGLIEFGSGEELDDHYRGTIELYPSGKTVEPYVHRAVELAKNADGVFHFDVTDIPLSDTDIYLWVDRGSVYDASHLNSVTMETNHYTPYDKTREAFYGHISVKPSTKGVTNSIKTKTPYAPYRILASDLDAYEKMKTANDWPDVKDLRVRVSYIGYLPCSFDVLAGRPNDAVRGVSYECGISFLADGTPVLAEDRVLVNGTDTNIGVLLDIINPGNGDIISSSGELAISCHYGSRAIAVGDILSAGTADGVVGIDTRWEGEYDIVF